MAFSEYMNFNYLNAQRRNLNMDIHGHFMNHILKLLNIAVFMIDRLHLQSRKILIGIVFMNFVLISVMLCIFIATLIKSMRARTF